MLKKILRGISDERKEVSALGMFMTISSFPLNSPRIPWFLEGFRGVMKEQRECFLGLSSKSNLNYSFALLRARPSPIATTNTDRLIKID